MILVCGSPTTAWAATPDRPLTAAQRMSHLRVKVQVANEDAPGPSILDRCGTGRGAAAHRPVHTQVQALHLRHVGTAVTFLLTTELFDMMLAYMKVNSLPQRMRISLWGTRHGSRLQAPCCLSQRTHLPHVVCQGLHRRRRVGEDDVRVGAAARRRDGAAQNGRLARHLFLQVHRHRPQPHRHYLAVPVANDSRTSEVEGPFSRAATSSRPQPRIRLSSRAPCEAGCIRRIRNYGAHTCCAPCLPAFPTCCWWHLQKLLHTHSANRRCTVLRFISAGRLPTKTVRCRRSASSSAVSLCAAQHAQRADLDIPRGGRDMSVSNA